MFCQAATVFVGFPASLALEIASSRLFLLRQTRPVTRPPHPSLRSIDALKRRERRAVRQRTPHIPLGH